MVAMLAHMSANRMEGVGYMNVGEVKFTTQNRIGVSLTGPQGAGAKKRMAPIAGPNGGGMYLPHAPLRTFQGE